jgi:hypothetical protein
VLVAPTQGPFLTGSHAPDDMMGRGTVDAQQNHIGWSAGPLGALRSELDEGSDIAAAFTMLESCANAVRYAYVTRKITPTAAAELFASLRLTGNDGATWTIGASSSSWYRKTGARWEPSAPPFGIESAGALPVWAQAGIGGLISAAEQQMAAAQQQAAPSAENATETIAMTTTVATVVKKPATPASVTIAGTEEDMDWVLSEWSNPSAPAPMRTERAVGSVGLPERIPAAWEPSQAVDDAVDALSSPSANLAERVGATDTYRDALDEEPSTHTLPQDFFLPPEDSAKS